MDELLNKIREDLLKYSDPKVKLASKRFFKEEFNNYGVKAMYVHQIAKEHFKIIKNEPKEVVFEGCKALFETNIMEESLIACDWSYALKKQLEPNDFKVLENWIDSYITNWATCDTLCTKTVGFFIEQYPDYLEELKKWTQSKNLWKRRASAVSLIFPAKHGLFLNDILEIADNLMLDNEDMVQKGYGWMLKVASQTNQQAIFNYVMQHKIKMPRTALRYAIEKMPKELKQEAMKK